ncbi:MAG TPA: DUF2934 domain-containing protein [Vicinamibacterales bacterium]|nr:DUF2934 domain-containing protein [Vicinamibacterales bacterium]
MKVKVQKAASFLDRVEAVQRQIAERAYELFNLRGCALGRAVDDRLAAERERVWKPPVELVEKDGEFLVEAAIAGVPPSDLDVQVARISTKSARITRTDCCASGRPPQRTRVGPSTLAEAKSGRHSGTV